MVRDWNEKWCISSVPFLERIRTDTPFFIPSMPTTGISELDRKTKVGGKPIF